MNCISCKEPLSKHCDYSNEHSYGNNCRCNYQRVSYLFDEIISYNIDIQHNNNIYNICAEKGSQETSLFYQKRSVHGYQDNSIIIKKYLLFKEYSIKGIIDLLEKIQKMRNFQ